MQDWRDVSVWQRLAAEGGALIAAADAALARGESVASPAAIARLRKIGDPASVAAAIELVAARRKARSKFACADRLWCDVAGVEQASGGRVAAWKAARIRGVLGEGAEVGDLCSGIGGDSMALVEAGLRVRAYDLDPRRAWMTARNAGCVAEAADVESLDLRGRAAHVDPARRAEREGTRSWELDDHRPGRAWMERALRETSALAVKLSPGVDRRVFGASPIEWEFIADEDALVQAVAWSGLFARRPWHTRATVLGTAAGGISLEGVPDDVRPDRIEVNPRLGPGMFLNEPTPAIERAQLLTEATRGSGARELARSLGLVSSDAPLEGPWFEAFECVEECAGRADSIKAVLARHALGARSVRVRGRALDADQLTRELKGPAGSNRDGQAVIFAWRDGPGVRAVVTRVASSR